MAIVSNTAAHQGNSSPRSKWVMILLMLAASVCASSAQAAIPASERQALLDLYVSTQGNTWTSHVNWNGPPGSECTWQFVICDPGQAHVTSFLLNHLNLRGPLPPALFTSLPRLKFFDIGNNHVTGSIPSLAGSVNLTHFQVELNDLSGPIPSLSSLTEVVFFSAYGNRLTGQVPSLAAMTKLQLLTINDNYLSGPMPPWPNPTWVWAGASALCGSNYLDRVPNANWDTATGDTPWYQTCATSAPDPVFASGFEN